MEKIQEFIKAAKTKEREEFEKQRDLHLVSLGLVDETKTVKEYSKVYTSQYPIFDQEKNQYYRVVNIPLEVTDEEYEEIKRLTPPVVDKGEELGENKEQLLKVLNGIMLGVAIIATIVLIITAINAYRIGGYYFLAAVALLFISLLNWALVNVLINISNNLHDINSKLK